MDEACRLSLCPDCFIEGHIGHKKGRVKEIYENTKLTVNAALESLGQKTKELEDKIKATDEEIKKNKVDQPEGKPTINIFSTLLDKAAKNQKDIIVQKMTNFKEQQLNSQLREITEFKKNVQQMSICDCVNKAPQILQEAELLKLTQVEEFKQIEDPEYA